MQLHLLWIFGCSAIITSGILIQYYHWFNWHSNQEKHGGPELCYIPPKWLKTWVALHAKAEVSKLSARK